MNAMRKTSKQMEKMTGMWFKEQSKHEIKSLPPLTRPKNNQIAFWEKTYFSFDVINGLEFVMIYSQSSLFAESVFANLPTYSTFTCNPRINTRGTFVVTC